MQISPLANGGNRVDVSMTLTAQGCGMGSSIGRDAEAKLLTLPGVKEAFRSRSSGIPSKMSEAAKLALGIM